MTTEEWMKKWIITNKQKKMNELGKKQRNEDFRKELDDEKAEVDE